MEAKGHQNASVLFLSHIAQFSVVRFQQYAKGSWFFHCSWEGWPGQAVVCGRDTGRLPVWASLLNDPSNLHFAALFTGAASPRLAAGGISVGEGLLSAQLAEHHSSKLIFLSSNRISIFSKVNQTYTHTTAHGPLLTAPLAFHSSQEQRQVSVQCWCSFSSFPHIWLNHLHPPYKKHATSILSSWTVKSNSPRQKHPVCSKFEILGS